MTVSVSSLVLFLDNVEQKKTDKINIEKSYRIQAWKYHGFGWIKQLNIDPCFIIVELVHEKNGMQSI